MNHVALSDPLNSPEQDRIGLAELTQLAYAGTDLAPIASRLLIKCNRNPLDAGALMDLSTIEQLRGNLEAGLEFQAAALKISQVYASPNSRQTRLRMLVLAAPIHMGGNTPVEFLLKNSDIAITTLYVVPNVPLPAPLPEHDLVFIAAPGDADYTRRFLLEIRRHIHKFEKPVLNQPELITELERDRLCNSLAGIQGLISPFTVRSHRSMLTSLEEHGVQLEDALPLVIRPVGSHAGRNLEKIDRIEEIENYLTTCDDEEFFVTQFLDYRSKDGLFRKYRLVFVDGAPHAVHMAISDQWKIWYLNADMQESAEKLAEEERFMADFDDDFAIRHDYAFNALVKEINLDYFGIDCAETRDGQLVVFEADNALIVHDMDPVDIFPYKVPQMQKVFCAFQDMLRHKAGLGGEA